MIPGYQNWVKKFIVSDPRKHKKGFTVYKVTAITYPELSPESLTKKVVWKRYNDFKKLHEQLQIKHRKWYLKDTFPNFIKAKYFGRFEDDVIEERRKCAEHLLEFIAQHPPLDSCVIFLKFIESGYTVSEKVTDIAEEAPIVLVTESNAIKENNNVSPISDDPDSIMSLENTSARNETEGPFLKLEGTWRFPQVPDSISWSSQSSDDRTTFTDTDSAISGFSTPLQSADLQYFDPLQSPERTDRTFSSQVSNSWLLSMPSSSLMEDKITSSYVNEPFNGTNIDVNSLVLDASKLSIVNKNTIDSKCSEREVSECDSKEVQLAEETEHSNQNCQDMSLGDIFGTTSGQQAGYIFDAAHHVTLAQQREANGNFEAAFTCYKNGIACLLKGVQSDEDAKRKQFVRDKTAKYLLHAEKLYNENLAPRLQDSFHWKKSESELSRPPSELKAYKVLGVIGKVMLALHRTENKCYVIKVLQKSPCPSDENKKTIIPQHIPFMVTIHHYIETESAVFLVLQHASGGRLWEHVNSYFDSLSNTPIPISGKGNAYFGKNVVSKWREREGSCEKEDSSFGKVAEEISKENDTFSPSSQDQSYLDLIRDYTSTTKMVENNYRTNVSVGEKDLTDSNISCKNNKLNMPTSVPDNINCKPKNINEQSRLNEMFLNCDDLCSTVIESAERELQEQSCAENNSTSDLHNLSWKNLDKLETSDLLENAQKLIQSVNETILESASQLRHIDSPISDVNENFIPHPEDMNSDLVKLTKTCGNSGQARNVSEVSATTDTDNSDKMAPKSSNRVVRGKSAESAGRTRERKSSAVRRRSATSRSAIERRFSTDDMCEGRARTMSGSLDRGHQWSRYLSLNDCHRPLLPETTVRHWASQMVICLESLHQWGIICKDLHPDNILLGEKGCILVSYMCQWTDVDSFIDKEAVNCLYSAPEVELIFPVTPAADWWSLGAILFDLLTGKTLASCHPAGIQSHTVLNVPDYVSKEASSILTELLRYNPEERLGSGVNGSEELKSHPFFKEIDWSAMQVKHS